MNSDKAKIIYIIWMAVLVAGLSLSLGGASYLSHENEALKIRLEQTEKLCGRLK